MWTAAVTKAFNETGYLKVRKSEIKKKEKPMKTLLIKVLSIALVMAVLTACGSAGQGTSGGASTNDHDTYCPVGEWYSTNGMRDFISVGNDNQFNMERTGEIASGSVNCIDGQTFLLTIEASNFGEVPANGTNVQGEGTYTCRWSVAEYTMNIRCTGGNTASGNYFYTAKTYFLPGYYR